MMLSEWLAIGVNLLVSLYLIYYYPKTQAKAFQGINTPRAFILLRGIAKSIGYAVIAASLIYVVYRFMWA